MMHLTHVPTPLKLTDCVNIKDYRGELTSEGSSGVVVYHVCQTNRLCQHKRTTEGSSPQEGTQVLLYSVCFTDPGTQHVVVGTELSFPKLQEL